MEGDFEVVLMKDFELRAEELDGGYFEKFTTLDWKEEGLDGNENQIEKVENLPEPKDLESIEEGAGSAQEVVGTSSEREELSTHQREALFGEVLYTVMHRLGATDASQQISPGYLHGYAQEVLHISEERHHELYTQTKDRQPPGFYLKVSVIKARNLEAKDANGLSDPYCMLGLMKEEIQESQDDGKRKRGKLKKSPTLRQILKDEAIKVTTVRENTLNPEWNESFILEVKDALHERLHIDLWDCDDKTMLSDKDNKITKIKGFHGVGRYFKDVVQSARATENEIVDDFLGYFDIPIKDIPVDGIDAWFVLHTKSSKCRVSGDCHIKVTLSSGQRPDLPSNVRVYYPTFADIYGALLHEFIAFDLNKAKENAEQYRWSGQLSIQAEYILHQIAVQNDLTPLQEAAMRWRFYSDRHWTDPMQYDMLCELAHDVTKLWRPKRLAPKEDRALLKSLRQFVDNCLELLIKHRDLYPPTDSARFGRLINLIECLNAVCEMDAYQEEEHEPLRVTLTNILKESAVTWYKKTRAWKEPQEASTEITRLSYMVDVAECVVADLLKAHKFYRKVFFLVGVDYFTISYNQFELLLANDVQNEMQRVNKVIKQPGRVDLVGEKLFALYLAVKDILQYRKQITSGEGHVSALDDFHQWFKTSVSRWFDIAEDKAKERIKKAVAVDKFLRIDPTVMHSTSAVDTAGCFHQIREFWRMLDWPDPVGSYCFVTQITNIICSGASYYADLLFEKMLENNYYDNDPSQFDVSEQLCVSLNDIQHVRLWLEKLPETLGWQKIIAAMATVHGEKGGKHVRVAMETMLNSADEDMQQKISTIISHIGQMMSVDVKKFVIHLSWGQNPKPAEEAVGPLLKYLDDDLMVLNKSVMKFIFEEILEFIWEIVIECFNNMIKSSRGNPPAFYTRLEKAIEIVKSFFHADGIGLNYDKLTSGPIYKCIEEALSVRKMSSEELIQMYLAEKCEKQEQAEEKFGAVTIRAFYDSLNKKVLVEVLNARNLPPLDTNGLSDPYVNIRVMPAHIFGRQERKTKVVKNTLFPLFDETFEFSVTPEQCKTRGVCLSLTVLDYDVLTNDDIEGHAFLALRDLSGLDEPIPGGFANEPQNTLNLHHPAPRGLAFEILECRQDKLAESFVKEEKTIYEKTLSAHA